MKTVRLLFSDDMARAIVSGRKTVTRRPIVPQPDGEHVGGITGGQIRMLKWRGSWATDSYVAKSLVSPGDILIGRECWGYRGAHCCSEDGFKAQTRLIAYRADGARASIRRDDGRGLPKQRAQRDDEADDDYSTYLSQRWQAWTPSIQMPDWAARIRRRVVSVTVERVQDITEEDAVREGFEMGVVENYSTTARDNFSAAWESIYAAKGLGWDVNPWAWRIEFERENVQEVSNGR